MHAVAEATLAPAESPVFNTIARIDGSEKPNEYVMLSAHLDSWDAGSGATDNGTGTITMLEAMRILKTAYPRPKRTILVGHWSGEEEGDIGSGAFAADHPEVLAGLQALFNQDNGTGEIDTRADERLRRRGAGARAVDVAHAGRSHAQRRAHAARRRAQREHRQRRVRLPRTRRRSS